MGQRYSTTDRKKYDILPNHRRKQIRELKEQKSVWHSAELTIAAGAHLELLTVTYLQPWYTADIGFQLLKKYLSDFVQIHSTSLWPPEVNIKV